MILAALLEDKQFQLAIREDELVHQEFVLGRWESRLRKRQDQLDKHKVFLLNYEVKLKERWKENKEETKENNKE